MTAKPHQHGLVWFTQDCRLHDNPVLARAHAECAKVMHVFFVKDVLRAGCMPGLATPSEKRQNFLYQALSDLQSRLQSHGHDLFVLDKRSVQTLPRLLEQYAIARVYRSQQHGYDESKDWQTLKKQCPLVKFVSVETHSLYEEQALPFTVDALPDQFTTFRKRIEKDVISLRQRSDQCLWASPIKLEHENQNLHRVKPASQGRFSGGETAALAHLKQYFSADFASHYKQTRNALMGFEQSTKFSPWLAQGSLSVIQVMQVLKAYEQTHGANDSTYWIYFELLWREYFYWLAIKMGKQLFIKRGLRKSPPLTSFYPARFQQWVNGTTAWPIVNACMRELDATGYMSNRGRQIVASCLINELQLDWRYGAAYFEQQLIDYDVGANWGNWQYLAGVGVDPRGQRRFDLDKQTQRYDPEGVYIAHWQGAQMMIATESSDASDSPV